MPSNIEQKSNRVPKPVITIIIYSVSVPFGRKYMSYRNKDSEVLSFVGNEAEYTKGIIKFSDDLYPKDITIYNKIDLCKTCTWRCM